MGLKSFTSKKATRLPWIITLMTLTVACTSIPAQETVPSVPIFSVDDLFSDFYSDLGGEARLGPVISQAFTYGQISYQYTQAALMAYDPRLEGWERFYLAAIGLDTGLMQATQPPPKDPTIHYANGHSIDPSFWPLIQSLGGLSRVGNPITEARYNPVKKRIEQYFENLGFYHLENPSDVGLLAYGLWRCGNSCSLPPIWPEEAEVVLPPPPGAKFSKTVMRLGEHFVGFGLTPPFPTPDGGTEQIFENIVLKFSPKEAGQPTLLPLTKMLGMEATPPQPPSSESGMFFYPIRDRLGYNVPKEFLDYLAQHGSLDASGPPISQIVQVGDGVLRQCFVNLCLEKHERERGALRIRPAPLGYLFWQNQNQATTLGELIITPETAVSQGEHSSVTVQAWKRHAILRPGQQQEIGLTVIEDNRPVEGVGVELIFPLPDGSQRNLTLPPTKDDGSSSLTMEVPEVPPGTILSYTLCAYYPRRQPTCTEDRFLVWR